MKARNRALAQTDDSDVVLYIRHLLEGKKSVSGNGTIVVAISAIRNHFKYDALKSAMLSSTMVSDAVKIGKRDAKKVVKKKPLTVHMLIAMHAWYTDEASRVYRSDMINWTDVRDICMMILMMAAFLRESEVIMLLATEVKFTQAVIGGVQREIVEIYISRAKNDQSSQGHLIRIGDASESAVCPVFWMKLLSRKRERAARLGVRFFQTFDGCTLSRTTPCGIIQKWIDRINSRNARLSLPTYGAASEYGSHSCRIGGVTAAHASGVDMELIRQHGNWKSDVVYDYIQPTVAQQLSVTQFMQ
jgi:hypothetical protein